MIIPIITLGLIVVTALLVKNANKEKSIKNYAFVLVGGVVTLLFEPAIIALYTNGSADGGAIQLVSTIVGIYFIIWSIVRMIKFNKEKKATSPTTN